MPSTRSYVSKEHGRSDKKKRERESKQLIDACVLTDKPAPDLGPASDASASPAADGRLRQFVHRLASLDQQIRTMEAKIYICNEDVRQLVTGTMFP